MTQKPNLSFWKLWNLSFGFFGVQIAYALQSANISRIFATLGADPHNLSYFWILPPLMGILVQPHSRYAQRQDMVSLRASHPIPLRRSHSGCTGNVSAAQCRFVRYGCRHGHGLRTYLADVSRHEHQYGHAAVQDACGRHGE